jgi:hypothetical protein
LSALAWVHTFLVQEGKTHHHSESSIEVCQTGDNTSNRNRRCNSLSPGAAAADKVAVDLGSFDLHLANNMLVCRYLGSIRSQNHMYNSHFLRLAAAAGDILVFEVGNILHHHPSSSLVCPMCSDSTHNLESRCSSSILVSCC